MIKSMKLIPTEGESLPFAEASLRLGFDALNYVEEEFFFEGTSNLYEEDEHGKPQAFYQDAPYCNRLLVRRPSDLSKFSGNVVVEILNPSAHIDIDRMWVFSWKYFTRHGDIYIGVTSKPDVLKALKAFDPVRYAPIAWDNPLPGREAPKTDGPFGVLPEHEAGLFWDMLTDLAALLRTDSALNPIAACPAKFLYLTGWSQSGAYLVRYRNTFADLASAALGRPVYDGWLEAGAGSMPCPIHSFSPWQPFFQTPKDFRGRIVSREPYIAVNTESENETTHWSGDSTRPGELFRIYEIAGSSHDSKYNLLDYYQNDIGVKRSGHGPEFYGLEEFPIDYPYEFLMNAAFRSLFVWVRDGVPAPASRQTVMDVFGKNAKDLLGNTLGGLRSPFIDLPTCIYSKYCTLKTDPSVTRDFFGHVEPFSPEKLATLYGTLSNYRALVADRTDEIIAEGYLLQDDREEIIEMAVGFARERGLGD